jgi:hypothetical protein
MILKILIFFLIIVPMIGIWGLSSYLLENKSNHTGFELLLLLWPLCFCAVSAIIIYIKKKTRLVMFTIALNLAAIFFYLFVDHFNIMVQYDRWCHRGMPMPFEASRR